MPEDVRPITAGTRIIVRAWWTRPVGEPVAVRVVGHTFIGELGLCYTVEPLQGNNHHRWVKLADVIDHDLHPKESTNAQA